MEDLFISMAVSIILSSIKNPAKKKTLRAAMLKIRNQINLAYTSDPDFNPKAEE